MTQTVRAWYLEHFAQGQQLAGKDLRRHVLGTLAELNTLATDDD